MLKSDFKLDYANPSSVHYLLTQLDLSWITSRFKHPKQDLKVQSLYKKLQTKGNRCFACGRNVWIQDETRVSQQDSITRM